MDDNDIWCALKVWSESQDFVLSTLSKALVDRRLFKIKVSNDPFDVSIVKEYTFLYAKQFGITEYEASYLFSSGSITTNMYNDIDDSIDIIYNDGTIKGIAEASDMLNIQLLSKNVAKYYLAYYTI